jgi:uncharacterized membrane protein YozB (DUF420 family)
MLHSISTLVLVILAVGIYFRRRPEIHMKAMLLAFIIDLSLVLYIELTRQAVEKVASEFQPFLWFHAAISLSVLVHYVAMIVLGRRLAKARSVEVESPNRVDTAHTRKLHRNLGISFVVFRLANYITAFMM